MLDSIFWLITEFEALFWGYIGIALILGFGAYFTWASRCFQLRQMGQVLHGFFSLIGKHDDSQGGVHPLKVFFAAVGGCVGLGNLVGICQAVMIGGPGAVFWMWVAGFLGMTLKYAEIFLGMRFRVPAADGNGYDGGPMHFLKHAFPSWVPKFVCVLLCIYGVEIFMFRVITDSITTNWHVNRYLVIAVLLMLVLFAGAGGVRRVGEISTVIIPLFLLGFAVMSIYIIAINIHALPGVLKMVLSSAFSGKAAVGAFAGSTVQLAMANGIAGGCYTGDLGIGYASVIHSESSADLPERQAALGIFGIVLDTFVVCTFTLLLILLTGVWSQEGLQASDMVQAALETQFPYMNFFMPLLIFFLGYSTMIAYFCVGLKCARAIWPNYGHWAFYLYGVGALLTFSFVPQVGAYSVMMVTAGLLVMINLTGLFLLRKELRFDLRVLKKQ